VPVDGTLADGHGAPLAGVHLVIEELPPPDGGLVAYQVTTDAAGRFSADVEPWGTAAAPATLTIATPNGEVQTVNVIDGRCSRTFSVTASTKRDVALADGPTDPFALTATMALVGEACEATATPAPATGRAHDPELTPPPTDVLPNAAKAAGDGFGSTAIVAFALGLGVALASLTPRRRRRRGGRGPV